MNTTTHATHAPQVPAAAGSPVLGNRRHILDRAEAHFQQLDRAGFGVDGEALGRGLPARWLRLAELRSVLLHPATSQAARDAVWAQLVTNARRGGPAWTLACTGLALPGVKVAVGRLRRLETDPARGTQRIAGDVLSAFCLALHTADLDRPWIAKRLLRQAFRAVENAWRTSVKTVPIDPADLAELAPAADPASAGHPEMVLAAAVRHGVISDQDAEIIAATRLEGVAPAEVAARWGLGYAALMKRRSRAEARLAEAIRGGGLRDDFADLMSKSGE